MDTRNVKPAGTSASSEEWYAMRATYRRELSAQRLLTAAGIGSYIPMRETVRVTGGRRRRVRVPAVSGLVFVYSDRNTLQRFKQSVPYLQYMTVRTGGLSKGLPIIVPEKQMRDFMAVSECSLPGTEYRPVSCGRHLSAGTRVRITGGPLSGVEGWLVRPSSGGGRVAVTIEGVVSVTTARISRNDIEEI